MDLMPYMLEKGPPWSVTESLVATSKKDAYDALLMLRDKTKPITDLKAFSSSTLNAGPTDTYDKRSNHFKRHWLGYTRNKRGGWRKQQYARDKAEAVTRYGSPDAEPTTGWWNGYYGDVEGILRETFCRALEVALDIRHGATLRGGPSSASRLWPITIVMKCPTPWFEGWVSWRNVGTNGHVYVHLLVPNHHKANVLSNPLMGRKLPDWEVDPPRAIGDNGMWVISHKDKEFHPGTASSLGRRHKRDPFNHPALGPIWTCRGGIAVVGPSEPDGGVLHAGRPWKP